MYRYHPPKKNSRGTGFAMFSKCPKHYRLICKDKEETPFFPGGFLIKCLPDAVLFGERFPLIPVHVERLELCENEVVSDGRRKKNIKQQFCLFTEDLMAGFAL